MGIYEANLGRVSTMFLTSNFLQKIYKLFFLHLFLLLSINLLGANNHTSSESQLDSIVTNGLANGRLGDQLVSYMHAKWVAYKYNLPFYYKPFTYSDQLMLDDLEPHYNNKTLEKRRQVKIMKNGQLLEQFMADGRNGIAYEIPYFPESLEELQPTVGPDNYHWHRRTGEFTYFAVDWNNPEFKKIIQVMVAPKKPLNLVKLPKDRFTIAIQVRKNGNGFDLPLLHNLSDEAYNPKAIYVDVVFPFKHPPEEYFIEQLKYVVERFKDKRPYVYIFTDDSAPQAILERIKQAVNSPYVEFACRETVNTHYSNVLEDLFSITQFDCFIRPDSNLGITAAKLGNFKMVISPAHHRWEKHSLIIDKVDIQERLQ